MADKHVSTMKNYVIFLLSFIALNTNAYSQSEEYTLQKQKKLSVKSPFEKIIDRELPATIEYEDDEIIAFIPLRSQAPVHILIVPKKRIPTMNDIQAEDAELLGRMMLVAKDLAKEKGISETGYRLAFNTNENSGQSVFHIHLHLLGGKKLGPMTTQDYEAPEHKE
jgi:histidine triad (HIT) family protein